MKFVSANIGTTTAFSSGVKLHRT